MTWSEVSFWVVVGLALVVWWVWVAASRLDRLHRKVGASRAVVDAQLVRRATVAAELATSGLLDPASSVLLGEASWAALAVGGSSAASTVVLPADLADLLVTDGATNDVGEWHTPAGMPDRERIESELSATLREVLDDADEVAALLEDPTGDELLAGLSSAWYRVQLARRFHNEAVAQTQAVRRGLFVRTLRLAGRAPEPRTLELDDAWPENLDRPGARTLARAEDEADELR
ncbi:hypothetical protein [Cellulomonas alba]|uniref:NUDIX hydrolase n=1 Tax=Cellulomonas alba TaxID=3053467 RepID=A0ABT7SB80_9CELL|nr:hypothetical protein [Cellulomonas alba]MDM7853449.1 hypothetical protein [Cellulomonas alba]